MTWVKLPDDALEDPRVADVPPDALVAYLRTLGWSNRWARDGRIPSSSAGDATKAWADAGLVEIHSDHIQLVWLLEYQPKADEIKESKRLAAERQERHRRHMANDHSKCDSKRCLVLLKAAKGNGTETRDKTRDKRPLRSDSDPSLPEGRGEETGIGDTGSGAPVAEPTRDKLTQRRELARAIRDAPNDLDRRRYQRTFEKQFGGVYGRQVTA